MKKLFLIYFVGLGVSALAVDGNHAKYIGGTVPGMNIGVIGRIDLTSTTSLNFEASGNKISIPYNSIESFEHSTEVARHLGVLPAIVVGLLKARQRRHFVGISYRDPTSGALSQVIVLEIPKGMSRTLERVLQTRAPRHSEMPKGSCTSSS